MVKSKERARRKMLANVRTAGAELKAGMEEGPDPIDIALKNPAEHAAKMKAGLDESIRRGKLEAGLKKAKQRNAYRTSIDKAAMRYEQSADVMVERSMEGYDERAACQERAAAKVAGMPTMTRDQRLAKGYEYQKAVAIEFDKMRGLKS
jgi:hypothetical protein